MSLIGLDCMYVLLLMVGIGSSSGVARICSYGGPLSNFFLAAINLICRCTGI